MANNMYHNDIPQTTTSIGLLLYSVLASFFIPGSVDRWLQVVLHLTQIAAAGMACVVAYHTIRKNLKNKTWLLIPLLIFVASSCNTPRAIERACIKCGKTAATVVRVDSFMRVDTFAQRDTIITIQRDESSITALLKCDSLGNVLMHIIDSVNNGRAKPSATIKHNVLSSRCICDTANIALQWLERNTFERKMQIDSVVVIQPEYRDQPLGGWAQLKIDYGGWAFGLIALVVGIKLIVFILKQYFKIQMPWTRLI